MHNVETTFKLSFTDDQYHKAKEYVNDMKNHRNRVYWIGKENKTDEELILAHIAHKILSGFYTNYDPSFARELIKGMEVSH